MNAMECSSSPTSRTGSEDDERDEVDALSQRMGESLHSGSQRTPLASQNGNVTPEAQESPQRLRSIPLSDPGALYGPEDDLGLSSQGLNPSSSQGSLSSQLSNQRSDREGGQSAGRRGRISASATTSFYANRAIPNSIYDSQRYPFYLGRYYHPDGLLVCPDRHREFLYSQAKCMGLSVNREKHEAYGVTWSFVFPFEGFGLPEQMLKAIHFFTIVESLSTHNKMNKYVVQTNNLKNNLYPNYNDKDITGVLEGTCAEDAVADPENPTISVDLNDLLKSSESNSSGMVYQALPLLRMNIGITGALYKSQGKEKRKLFGILYVHWLLNVDFMQLLLVCAPSPHVRACLLRVIADRVMRACDRKRFWRSRAPGLPILIISTRRATSCLTRLSRFSWVRRWG
jgi:hypothetical protein